MSSVPSAGVVPASPVAVPPMPVVPASPVPVAGVSVASGFGFVTLASALDISAEGIGRPA